MKLIAGFLAAALAQDSDRWGFYDYYGNGNEVGGKSQSSQTGTTGQLAGNAAGTAAGNTEAGILGNGRICWSCNERSYGTCLGAFDMSATSKNIGDMKRHGAMYCTGEDYFCFISERRIIRHDGNDYNYEKGQPWSAGTLVTTVYQEESIAFGTSNQSKNTNIKVEMGCQQPMACLRQMNQNYKIDMGMPYHHTTVPLVTSAAAKFAGLAREGLCRLGKDWVDYASGVHAGDNWRERHWRGDTVTTPTNPTRGFDRRYGAGENHYNYGKGTESVCHYCCDPLLEFSGSTGLYDYKGCNFNALSSSAAAIESTGADVATGTLAVNLFLNRQQNWESPVWNDNRQYHGMFRNPHSHYPRKTITTNTGGAHPNA